MAASSSSGASDAREVHWSLNLTKPCIDRSASVALIRHVLRDDAVRPRHREQGEEATALHCDAGARRQRVVGDRAVGEGELHGQVGAERAVPDSAALDDAARSARGSGVVAHGGIPQREQAAVMDPAALGDRGARRRGGADVVAADEAVAYGHQLVVGDVDAAPRCRGRTGRGRRAHAVAGDARAADRYRCWRFLATAGPESARVRKGISCGGLGRDVVAADRAVAKHERAVGADACAEIDGIAEQAGGGHGVAGDGRAPNRRGGVPLDVDAARPGRRLDIARERGGEVDAVVAHQAVVDRERARDHLDAAAVGLLPVGRGRRRVVVGDDAVLEREGAEGAVEDPGADRLAGQA